MIRYHSFYPAHREGAYEHLMNDHDRKMFRWVRAVQSVRPLHEEQIGSMSPPCALLRRPDRSISPAANRLVSVGGGVIPPIARHAPAGFPQPVSDPVHDGYVVFSILRALDQVDALKSQAPILGQPTEPDYAGRSRQPRRRSTAARSKR